MKSVFKGVVFFSCFLLLMVPFVSVVQSHVVHEAVVSVVHTQTSFRSSYVFDFFLQLFQKMLKIYAIGFLFTFVFSLFFTIPVAIWITYLGSPLEILVTAFMLSLITAVKWPVLLVDLLLKLLPSFSSATFV